MLNLERSHKGIYWFVSYFLTPDLWLRLCKCTFKGQTFSCPITKNPCRELG